MAPKIEGIIYRKIQKLTTSLTYFIHSKTICVGIRIQSPKKGQISMDMDFRWGGDPNIVLGVEAALVANLPIQVGLFIYLFNYLNSFILFLNQIMFVLQLKDLQVFTVVRVIFQLCEEIPCISAVVVALLSEV